MMLMPLLSRVTPRVEVPLALPAISNSECLSADQMSGAVENPHAARNCREQFGAESLRR